MAYNYFEDEQNNEDANQQQQQTGQVQLGPQTGTQVSGDAKAQNSGAGGGTSSGAYTNLQSYLDANKSLNFGTDVAGQVQKKVDAANQTQNEAGTGFKADVDQNTVNTNDDLINQVGTDATQITSSPEKMSDFLRMRNAQYGGPNSLVDEADRYKAVTGATNTAQEEAEATKSEGGRKALLDKTYGSGRGRYDYSAGQKNLDNLLIQNDPNSRQAFESAQQGAQAAGSNLGSLKDQLAAYAGQGKATTAAARAAARGSVGIDDAGNVLDNSPIKQLQATAENRAKGYNTQKTQEFGDYQNALRGLSLNDAQLQRLGVSTGRTWGVDPTGYLSAQNDATAGSAATREEQAREAALAQLAGVDNTYLPDAGAAGSYDPTKNLAFNKSGYEGAVNAARAGIEPQVQKRDYATGVANTANGLTGVSGDDLFTMSTWNEGSGSMVAPLLQAEGIDYRTARSQYASPLQFAQAMKAKYTDQANQASSYIPANYLAELKRA